MRHLYRFFIACIFLLPGMLTATAQTENQSFPSNDGKEKTVIIRLKEQFDTNGSIRRKTKNLSPALKRETITKEMKAYHGKSQANFLASLEKTGLRKQLKTVKSYWIANVIACKATDEVIEQLKNNDLIESIKIDKEVNVIPEPMTEIDENSSAMYPSPDIKAAENDEMRIAENISLVRALEANAYGYTGKGVVMAIIDSGTNYDHQDLQGALWTDENYPNHGWDFSNNDNDPMDDMGHGTHCAGTIAGNGNAGTRTGVAPGVQLMILKAINKDGGTTEKIFWDAIEFAAEHQANVISVSAGWTKLDKPNKKAWRDIMVNLQGMNILFVAAAGNEGQYINTQLPAPDNVRTPGNCPAAWLNPEQPNPAGTSAMFTVGAVNEKGTQRIDMSSIGPVTWQDVESYNDYPYDPGSGLIKPDIMAPGNNVLSLNYATKKGYVQMTGTSMATPCVAGIAALVLSKNPALTPADIVRVICQTSIKLDETFNNYTGGGRADALLAALYAPNPDVNCTEVIFKEKEGYADGKLNPADKGELEFVFENTSTEGFSGYTFELISYSPYLTITKNSDAAITVPAGGKTTISGSYSVYVHPDAPQTEIADLAIIARKGDEVRTNLFRIPVYKVELQNEGMEIKETEGNGNGIADRGEKIELVFSYLNTGNAACVNLKENLSSAPAYLTFTGKEEETKETESGTLYTYKYRFDVASEVPDWQRIKLDMSLKGDNVDTTFIYNLGIGKTALLIVDNTRNGLSAETFRKVVEETKELSYEMVKELPASLDKYQSVWYFAGVYPNNHYLKSQEKDILIAYLEAGGRLYMEGGDVWYDKKVYLCDDFHLKFVEDNGGTLTNIQGCKEGFNENDVYPYTYVSKSIDVISPVDPAYALYKNTDPEFIVAVGYKDATKATIGSSFEIGGIASTEVTVPIDKYLNFFDFNVRVGSVYNPSNDFQENLQIRYRQSGDRLVINFLSPLKQAGKISLYTIAGYRLTEERTILQGDTGISLPSPNEKGIYLLNIVTEEGTATEKIIIK